MIKWREFYERGQHCHTLLKWFQGQIQLWVDIYPMGSGIYTPPPIEISPRKIEEYELRLIVWDVQLSADYGQEKNTWKPCDLVVKV